MGKFPIADKHLLNVWICRRCKGRNPPNSEMCRRCNYKHLRPKRARKKEVKGK